MRGRSRLAVLTRVLAAGVVFGFVIGAGGGVVSVLAHRYVQYGLLRLAAVTFQGFLGKYLLLFSVLFLALYGLWLLLVERLSLPKARVLPFLAMAVLVLVLALAVHWIVLPFPAMVVIKKTAGIPGRLLAGKIGIEYVVSLIRERLSAAAALALGVVLLLILRRGLRRLDWTRFLHHPRGSAVSRIAVVLLLVVLAFRLTTWIGVRLNSHEGFNVVIIGVDTLRADHTGCYGYRRATSPAIDLIADEGLLFERAFATTSWTLPSFHSIMTSLYPSSHGVVGPNRRLDRSPVTIAEILKDNGYRTAGFISGPFLKAIYGFAQGFDVYEESVSSASHIACDADITSPGLNEQVLRWLRKNSEDRFFLFIHYWDPHNDYIPPAPYDRMFDPYYEGAMDGTDIRWGPKVSIETDRRDVEHIVALYDGEIAWTDNHIGEVMAALGSLGLDDDTIIVVVSDHGEEFLEHGGKLHGMTLYNEVIHVPLVFRVPGMSGHLTFQTAVSLLDVMPTVLDILDIDVPTPVHGRSLLPVIRGERPAEESRKIYSELGTHLAALMRGRWKLLYDADFERFELYDLVADYGETRNLAGADSAAFTELAGILSEWLRAKRSESHIGPNVLMDDKTTRQLKALGYIQ